MAFGLFKKHCPVCGQSVKKEDAVEKFGKYMCSEDHAKEYGEGLAQEESGHKGGCCGGKK